MISSIYFKNQKFCMHNMISADNIMKYKPTLCTTCEILNCVMQPHLFKYVIERKKLQFHLVGLNKLTVYVVRTECPHGLQSYSLSLILHSGMEKLVLMFLYNFHSKNSLLKLNIKKLSSKANVKKQGNKFMPKNI